MTSQTKAAFSRGLEGVVVDTTAISDVRSEGGLSYRGIAIEELVHEPFHEVARWVVTGAPKIAAGEAEWHTLLARHCNLTDRECHAVLAFPAATHPMRVLQAMVPLLDDLAIDAGLGEADRGLLAAAKLPAIVVTHLRRERIHLDEQLNYIERFIHALGVEVEVELVAALNCAQVLQIEHSFNAGTFAARVVASTLAQVDAAIAAGIGALSGGLHGGADEAALTLADQVSDSQTAKVLVREQLAAGHKLPGMGHREYRARDPRANLLEDALSRLLERAGTRSELAQRHTILRAMETEFRHHMAQRDKDLYANVDFYKGLIYRQIGLPNHFFTAAFAMARVFGYLAHFIESRQDNRIFRPKAQYVGG